MISEEKREYNRKYHLDRYHKIKKKMLFYLGGECVACGTTEDLDIHHKDRSKKSFNISVQWGRSWKDLAQELDKCELRCRDHHIQIHEAEHGTISRYRGHRCRCDLCKKVWNEACKKWSATYRKAILK